MTKDTRTHPTDNSGSQTTVSIGSNLNGGGYTEAYPYNYTILIQEGTVIRLVFEVTTGDTLQPARQYTQTESIPWTFTARAAPIPSAQYATIAPKQM